MRQIDLSEALAVSKDSITRWENGLREPSAGYIKQLASVLGTSVAFLVGEANEFVQRSFEPNEVSTKSQELALHEAIIASRTGESKILRQRRASLEDFFHAREASRDVTSLSEHDLNAAEEMLLASLEAIRKEKTIRAE